MTTPTLDDHEPPAKDGVVRADGTSQTIAAQVTAMRADSAHRLPPEIAATFADERAAFAAAGVPHRAIRAGDRLPAFALPDAVGATRTLAELTAEGPAVIVFYRGGWCPYCNIALRTYERDLLPALRERSVALAAISPETPDSSLTTAEKDELSFTVLSDEGAELAGALGITVDPGEATLAAQRSLGVDIRATRGDGGTRLPMPTVLVVDRSGTVRFVDIQPDYTSRTEVAGILAALDRPATTGSIETT